MNILQNDIERFESVSESIKLTSKLGRLLEPAIVMTSCKFRKLDSVYECSDNEKAQRYLQIIKSLKKLVPEIPIILAEKFNNACYIPNLKTIVESDKDGERCLREFCDDLGANFNEAKKYLSDNMIFVGRKFYSPEVIAHEIGHYLNTINRGEVKGYKAHKRYGTRSFIISLIKKANVLLIGAGILIGSISSRLIALFSSAGLNVLSALLSRPIIIAEKTASITALKLLKKCNVIDSDYAEMQQSLTGALDTYKKGYVRNKLRNAAIETTVGAVVMMSDTNKTYSWLGNFRNGITKASTNNMLNKSNNIALKNRLLAQKSAAASKLSEAKSLNKRLAKATRRGVSLDAAGKLTSTGWNKVGDIYKMNKGKILIGGAIAAHTVRKVAEKREENKMQQQNAHVNYQMMNRSI